MTTFYSAAPSKCSPPATESWRIGEHDEETVLVSVQGLLDGSIALAPCFYHQRESMGSDRDASNVFLCRVSVRLANMVRYINALMFARRLHRGLIPCTATHSHIRP